MDDSSPHLLPVPGPCPQVWVAVVVTRQDLGVVPLHRVVIHTPQLLTT